MTTGFDWYLFDARDFHRLFVKDREFNKLFQKFKKGALAGTSTDYFYKDVAGKHLSKLTGELPAVHVRFTSAVPTAPAELANLWRIFSPAFLLKEYPRQRPDANTLNQEFYAELLYLMGLQEQTIGGVRRIGRCPEGGRQPGSLLENILYQMDIGHDLGRVPAETLADYGDEPARQREEIALALCLMWVNRLLFLKLLEGQLVRYHPAAHAADFRFLTPARIPDYDELFILFSGVLNRPPAQRPPAVRAAFRELPYLNSSLFQPAALEEQVLYVLELNDRVGLAPFPHSVLKKKGATQPPPVPEAKGQWLALPYLLGFLDAFDFGSDGSSELGVLSSELKQAATLAAGILASEKDLATTQGTGQESIKKDPTQNSELNTQHSANGARPLLSAAVLGLVFEKINGYRDGSFYTPGFVTMYMARHTLRRAVVRHFTQGAAAGLFPELKGCTSWQELRDSFEKRRRREYAAYFDTLTVLDPAVGSGHFLVSALNELLALKADLKLLLDTQGEYLDYTLRVVHDELEVLDNDTGRPAPYQVAHYDPATGHREVAPKHTRVQAALFHQKRALMEHALFGVDLNPNSVRICRLRLWIELLKHAYYRPDGGFQALETLPNLDLNVRVGNSLISRHPLTARLTDVFRRSGLTVERYKTLVHDYFGASGQAARQQLDTTLAELKANVGRAISASSPLVRKLQDAERQLRVLQDSSRDLFNKKLDDESYAAEHSRLSALVAQRRRELDDERQGTFFAQAFEWRFEFPEVLDEDAGFRGFDVVLGNPPYIRQEAFAGSKPFFKQRYATFDGKADLYVYFIELALGLLAPGGELSFIAPNKWLRAGYGAPLRRWLQSTQELVEFVDFGDLPVFAEATTYPAILSVQHQKPTEASSFRAAALPRLPTASLDELVDSHVRPVTQATLSADGWNLADDDSQALLNKLKAAGKPLGEYVGGKIYYGIKTGSNVAFVIDANTRARLIAEDARSEEMIKPFLAGRDMKRYQQPRTDKYLLFTRRGINMAHYPAVLAYLTQFKEQLEPRPKNLVGKEATDWPGRKPGAYKWYEMQDSIDYYKEFEQAKIIFPDIASKASFTIDTGGNYLANTGYSVSTDDKFLLGVLNSEIVELFFRSLSSTIRGGYMRFIKQYVEQIPIPHATAAQQAEIAALVEGILAARAADAAADTRAAEAAIDALVSACYGLSAAEAAAVRRPEAGS